MPHPASHHPPAAGGRRGRRGQREGRGRGGGKGREGILRAALSAGGGGEGRARRPHPTSHHPPAAGGQGQRGQGGRWRGRDHAAGGPAAAGGGERREDTEEERAEEAVAAPPRKPQEEDKDAEGREKEERGEEAVQEATGQVEEAPANAEAAPAAAAPPRTMPTAHHTRHAPLYAHTFGTDYWFNERTITLKVWVGGKPGLLKMPTPTAILRPHWSIVHRALMAIEDEAQLLDRLTGHLRAPALLSRGYVDRTAPTKLQLPPPITSTRQGVTGDERVTMELAGPFYTAELLRT